MYKSFIIIFLILVSLFSFSFTYAIERGINDTVMRYDEGGGSSKYTRTVNQTYLDILKYIFNRSNASQNSDSLTDTIAPTPTPTNNGSVPDTTPQGLPVNQTFVALNDLYEYVGQKVGVPTCILKAISYIEYPTAYNFSASQVQTYSQPGQTIPNCPWNLCSAAGHMQMTMGRDEQGSTSCNRCCWQGKCQTSCPNAWATHGRAVNQYDGTTHTPNVCNLKDSTFAAARKLKTDSGTAPGNRNWTDEQMMNAGRSYYGNCTATYPRLDNLTYCGYLIQECRL